MLRDPHSHREQYETKPQFARARRTPAPKNGDQPRSRVDVSCAFTRADTLERARGGALTPTIDIYKLKKKTNKRPNPARVLSATQKRAIKRLNGFFFSFRSLCYDPVRAAAAFGRGRCELARAAANGSVFARACTCVSVCLGARTQHADRYDPGHGTS